VEADEDTDIEVGDNAGTGPDIGGAMKSRRKTRSTVTKQSASTAAAAISAVNAAEKKKRKRKRKASSPLVVVMLAIPTPRSREVELEEEEEDEATEESPVVEYRPTRRSESPATKRQQELVEKTSDDALCRGLEAQRTGCGACKDACID
jgi:hypothetical protein